MVRTGERTARRLAAGVVAGATALVLTCCGGGGTTDSGVSTRPGPQPSTTSSPGTTTTSPSSSAVTGTGTSRTHPPATASDNLDYASNPALLRAAATAEGKVAGSTAISIESEDSGAQWEVKVATKDGVEHTMVVSRHGTDLVSGPVAKTEDASDRAKHQARVRQARLDYRQAALRVAGAVPQGRITELDLAGYRGKTVWEADVWSGTGETHALRIDARTGDVLTHRTGGS